MHNSKSKCNCKNCKRVFIGNKELLVSVIINAVVGYFLLHYRDNQKAIAKINGIEKLLIFPTYFFALLFYYKKKIKRKVVKSRKVTIGHKDQIFEESKNFLKKFSDECKKIIKTLNKLAKGASDIGNRHKNKKRSKRLSAAKYKKSKEARILLASIRSELKNLIDKIKIN